MTTSDITSPHGPIPSGSSAVSLRVIVPPTSVASGVYDADTVLPVVVLAPIVPLPANMLQLPVVAAPPMVPLTGIANRVTELRQTV